MLDRALLRLLRRMYHKGKGLLARALDRALGCLAGFLGGFAALWTLHAGLRRAAIGAAALTAAGALLLALVQRARFAAFVRRTWEERRTRLRLEKLLLLPRETFERLCRAAFAQEVGQTCSLRAGGGWLFPHPRVYCRAFVQHPLCPVSAQQALRLLRHVLPCAPKEILLLCPAPFDEPALRLLSRAPCRVRVLPPRRLLACRAAALAVSDEEVAADLRAQAAHLPSSRELWAQIFTPGKRRAYLLGGGALLLWGALFGMRPLLALSAGVSLALGVLPTLLAQKKTGSDVFPAE